jgi:hypothetical protein
MEESSRLYIKEIRVLTLAHYLSILKHLLVLLIP